MTVKEIQLRVAEIRKLARTDFEVAHAKEDELFEDVLAYIGEATFTDPQTLRLLARAALKSKRIDFPRPCA